MFSRMGHLSLTTFLSFFGIKPVVSMSGGMISKENSLLGGGGVVVVVVVVVVSVELFPSSPVSLVALFLLEAALTSYSLQMCSTVASGNK